MPKNKTLRYFMFGSLYFTQGTNMGYFVSSTRYICLITV